MAAKLAQRLTLAFGLAIGLASSAAAQGTIPGTYGPVTTMPPPVYQAGPSRLPNAPPRLDTFQDRATRCIHYGTTQGIGTDKIGQYTRECVNAR